MNYKIWCNLNLMIWLNLDFKIVKIQTNCNDFFFFLNFSNISIRSSKNRLISRYNIDEYYFMCSIFSIKHFFSTKLTRLKLFKQYRGKFFSQDYKNNDLTLNIWSKNLVPNSKTFMLCDKNITKIFCFLSYNTSG